MKGLNFSFRLRPPNTLNHPCLSLVSGDATLGSRNTLKKKNNNNKIIKNNNNNNKFIYKNLNFIISLPPKKKEHSQNFYAKQILN